MVKRVKKKVLPKDEKFQTVIQQFPFSIGQSVLFEMLINFYIQNINFLDYKK